MAITAISSSLGFFAEPLSAHPAALGHVAGSVNGLDTLARAVDELGSSDLGGDVNKSEANLSSNVGIGSTVIKPSHRSRAGRAQHCRLPYSAAFT
jgi:hypothetical protein